MKLIKINDIDVQKAFRDKGYMIPSYDREEVRARTKREPAWVHFGTGNIFRAFPAAVIDDLIEQGIYDKGVIAVEGSVFLLRLRATGT